MGSHGGEVAAAFGTGCVATAGVLVAAGKWIWETFGDKRIKQLEAELASVKQGRSDDAIEHRHQRERDREDCRRETEDLNRRIVQLEAILFAQGGMIRNDAQAAISEERIERTKITPLGRGAYKLENKEPDE